ncbi:MAG: hypothetical protein LLG05_05200 [Porphyromonadaceae bacterium]|nr:hypothetical protein [Porphyromonadaceae bacterium]
MKANRLRIGNYLQDFGGNVAQVIHLSKYKIILETPIPLTEELIRKFHNDDEIEKNVRFPNEITIYDRFLFIWKQEYKYWYVITAYYKEYLTKIEFVHEYQNFIFTLTGNELTLRI